jgi:hypothetical protein
MHAMARRIGVPLCSARSVGRFMPARIMLALPDPLVQRTFSGAPGGLTPSMRGR